MCVSPSAATAQEEDLGQFEPVDSLEESATSLVSSSTSAYSSFPVDVVVYVRVQVRTSFSHLLMAHSETRAVSHEGTLGFTRQSLVNTVCSTWHRLHPSHLLV